MKLIGTNRVAIVDVLITILGLTTLLSLGNGCSQSNKINTSLGDGSSASSVNSTTTSTSASTPNPVPGSTPSTNGTGGCMGNAIVWAYENGEVPGWGDFDDSATTNYQDTSGAPQTGNYDAKTTISSMYGEWLYHSPVNTNNPTATNPQYGVRIDGCNFMSISLKPGSGTVNGITAAPPNWTLYAVLDIPNDQPTGLPAISLTTNGNSWVTYKIPLYKVINGVTYTNYLLPSDTGWFYKFGLQDHSGQSSNFWYGDQIFFTAN